jgi:hypothetical protein
LFVEGQVLGMYFFGYGNFVSTADDLGFSITKHLSVNASYHWDRALWCTTAQAITGLVSG